MSEFFRTVMGHKFYEADVPRAVKALERIASALEELGTLEQKKRDEAAREALKPEKKCGESICCGDPDCAERENKAEARFIAKQVWHKDGEIEVDDDAEVSVSLDPDGNPRGAYVQAWVYVEFTANKETP
jgi:hypothetical protein